MKTIKVLFKNSEYDFVTSVGHESNNKSITDYFIGSLFDVGSYRVENMQRAIGFKWLIKVTKEVNQGLKRIFIYDPKSNTRNAAIYDSINDCVLGVQESDTRPYYPSCDPLKHIINPGGFVLGCTLAGFACWCCHTDVYRLGVIPK